MQAGAEAELAGYRFSDPGLLRQALTHRSHSAAHNERLEFLGDAVLNCVIAEDLYRRFPELDEGSLSRVRASLVNGESLAALATGLAIGARLALGEGELRSAGRERPSTLANAVEAVIGAVFLDGGFAAARAFTLRIFDRALATLDPQVAGKDAKTLLQELLQGRRLPLPVYRVVATAGEAHAQSFRVECDVAALGIRATGEGVSRRSAEQAAARAALALGGKR